MKAFFALLVLVSLAACSAPADSQDFPNIADRAGLLTATQERAIAADIISLENLTGLPVLVATLPSSDGSLASLTSLVREMGVADGSDFLLLIFAPQDAFCSYLSISDPTDARKARLVTAARDAIGPMRADEACRSASGTTIVGIVETLALAS